MNLSRLQAVAETETEYSVSDFKSFTKDFSGVVVKKEKISRTLGSDVVFAIPEYENIVELENVDGKIFAVTDWGGVYEEYNGDNRINFVAYESVVKLSSVVYKGKRMTLALTPSGYCNAFDAAEVYSLKLPVYSKVVLCYGNTFYLATGNRLIFETFDNIENMNDGESPLGKYVCLPEDAGEIVALLPFKKKVLVFAQRAIYEFTAFGEEMDYQMKRLTTSPFEIDGRTVSKIGDVAIYAAAGKLFKFSGGKIQIIDTVKPLGNYSVCGRSATFNGKYLLPVTDGEEKRVFYYDLTDGSEGDFLSETGLVADGGYILKGDNVLRRLSDNRFSSEKGEWESVDIDFGSTERKAVKGIGMIADGKTGVVLSCDCGRESFEFPSSADYRKTNLTSRVFNLKIQSETGLGIEKLRMRYAIKGE